MNKEIEKLIKENFKNIAIRLDDLNFHDGQSLLAEYREWIFIEGQYSDILMLPYEAYTNRIKKKYKDINN